MRFVNHYVRPDLNDELVEAQLLRIFWHDMEAEAFFLYVISVVFPNKVLSKISVPWVIFKDPFIVCPEVRFVYEITAASVNFCKIKLLITHKCELKNSFFTQKILSYA